MEEIKDTIDQVERQNSCIVTQYPSRLKLQIPSSDQHYWSPELEVHLTEIDNGTSLIGKYGPHQNVWTLFVTLYVVVGVIMSIVLIFGLSRWQLGLSAKILWLVPVLMCMAFFLYLVSQVGQKLGAEQTFILHQSFEQLIGKKIHIH